MINFFQISPYIMEISWRAEISEVILSEMISFKIEIKKKYGLLLKDCVSGYHTLSLLFHAPFDNATLTSELQTLYQEIAINTLPTFTHWKIPVCYNGKDLESFSSSVNLSTSEIIALHTDKVYIVHFYGFMPGFLYLGGLRPELHHPRKENPERTLPAGSVAIGGKQTGIYPFESPGGWHIIGSCPIQFFDPNSNPPVWAKEGDRISFYSIDQNRFDNMKLSGNGLINETVNG